MQYVLELCIPHQGQYLPKYSFPEVSSGLPVHSKPSLALLVLHNPIRAEKGHTCTVLIVFKHNFCAEKKATNCQFWKQDKKSVSFIT